MSRNGQVNGSGVLDGSHSGQPEASRRKRERQRQKAADLLAEAQRRGMTMDALIAEKTREVANLRSHIPTRVVTISASVERDSERVTRSGYGAAVRDW